MDMGIVLIVLPVVLVVNATVILGIDDRDTIVVEVSSTN
jgi:hypothetical protein